MEQIINALTYALSTLGNMDDELTYWKTEIYEPLVIEKMRTASILIFPYVQFRQWHVPRNSFMIGVAPGMLSQYYCALLNRSMGLAKLVLWQNFLLGSEQKCLSGGQDHTH